MYNAMTRIMTSSESRLVPNKPRFHNAIVSLSNQNRKRRPFVVPGYQPLSSGKTVKMQKNKKEAKRERDD